MTAGTGNPRGGRRAPAPRSAPAVGRGGASGGKTGGKTGGKAGGKAPATAAGRRPPAVRGPAPSRSAAGNAGGKTGLKTGPKTGGPRRGAGGGTGGARMSAPGRPPGKKSAAERGLGGTQVEGRQAVRELLLAGRRKVTEVLISGEMDRSEIVDDIVELAQDLKVPVRELSRKRLDAASHTEASQGVVAHAHPLPEIPLADLTDRSRVPVPFLVALDGVTDPGNLGALIRTAECAGVTGIVLPRHRAVHVTPTVTKASAGAVEYVDLALVGGLPTAITDLQRAGITVIGLDAGGSRTIYDMAPLAGPVCLVLGAEGAGLSRLVRQRCDDVVSIPLVGQLGSLNVATAGAVAIYEMVRRRTAS